MGVEIVLAVEGLRKQFGQTAAVDGISFEIRRGQVLGLLGPNGAGKTTTIHMLMGLTRYDGGSITYFGHDLIRHRGWCLQRVNFTSAYNTLLGRISVSENLKVFAGLYNVADAGRRIDELVDYFEVREVLDQRFWSLSSGQRTRVNLIKSLLNDPELLLMDEPTASLDPDIADKTLALIEDLRQRRNLTLLYTSHNMAEVTRICDSVIFLDHGRIVAQDSPTGLTRRIPTAEVRLVLGAFSLPEASNWLEFNRVPHEFTSDRSLTMTVSEKEIPRVLFGFSQTGVEITEIEIHKPTLEDVFVQIARS
jgi:ABC-2 type transport system ATP-binding protein